MFDNTSNLVGDDLKLTIGFNSRVQVIASIFSIYGYEKLKKELENIQSFEFVFSDPMFIKNEQFNKEEKYFEIIRAKVEKSIGGTEFEVQLINQLNTRSIAQECAQWIAQKATFKSNVSGSFVQNYFNIIGESNFSYVPGFDFSASGFGYKKANDIGTMIMRVEAEYATNYVDNFNQLFNDETKLKDITQDVINFVNTLYKENSPNYIYFLTLKNIFENFLDDVNEDNLANEFVGFKNTVIYKMLYDFQKDAVTGIINKLETYSGCILADSVGLGKTFTALAVVKYYELRNKNVLVLCPKKLAQNWNTYCSNYEDNILIKDRFNYDVLFHTDLSRESGNSNGIDLSRINLENYDLIVIDESHNFRNNNSRNDHRTRYEILLEDVIKKGVKSKILMLSATPVNNKFMDLNNQLNLAYEGNTNLIDPLISKTKSIHYILSEAQRTFNKWSALENSERSTKLLYHNLNKNFEFFKLLDSLTIARSRKHIEKSYDLAKIGEFPKRNSPININSNLTSISGFISIDQVYEKLSNLNMSIYNPMEFINPIFLKIYEGKYDTITSRGVRFKQVDRNKSLQNLMRINFMKRLESSVHSFKVTLKNVLENISNNLEILNSYNKNKEVEVESIDDFIGNKIKIDLAHMDYKSWQLKLKMDFDVLSDILNDFEMIKPKYDSKLEDLKALICNKISNPINEGNIKVIVFTSFSDSANYLYDNLEYLGNCGLITGSGSNKNNVGLKNDFNNLLSHFSPISKNMKIDQNFKTIDILIATDCISEGQNLQDCDYLINYDIHWNPVRIIQRFGRIDRIGSLNKVIQLVNFWPNISLDQYINLKNRVEDKMKILDMSATGSDNVLDSTAQESEHRKRQLEQLKSEVLDLEDMDECISITDLGLNEFRMDLLEFNKNFLKGNTSSLGVHSVISKSSGLDAGCIFVLKNINSKIDMENQNQLHPFYVVYINNDEKAIYNHLNPKQILDLMRMTCKDKIEAEKHSYSLFNSKTKDGTDMSFYSNLLNKAINSIVNVKLETELDSLFNSDVINHNQVSGIDDFELITFLVII